MVKTMDKLEEAIRKVEEAVKSTADPLDVSNARLICTLSSVAVNTVLRELEIQLRREELFNEMASLSSPEFAEAAQMEADAVGPEPERGVVQIGSDQNGCKSACACHDKCYVDDVYSHPWTTVVRDMERDELLEQVTKLTLQVERLKGDNDRLRRSRAHR